MSFKKKYTGLLPLIVVSFIYLICIFALCLGDLSEVKKMKPNEWGDFLAGTFSPLAFMWLVFGYHQQGQELKQNTEALKLQAQELSISNKALEAQVNEMKKTVETQKNMFSLAEKQYEDSINEKVKNNIPVLSIVGSKYLCGTNYSTSEGDHRFNLTIKANNKPIKHLKIRSNFWNITKQGSSYDSSNVIEITSLEINKPVELLFYIITNTLPFQKNILNFDFYDEDGTKFSKKYELNKNEDQVVIIQEISLNS